MADETMVKSETLAIVFYFLLFMGTNIWLFVTLIRVIIHLFEEGEVKIDVAGKIFSVVAVACSGLSIIPLLISFGQLMLTKKKVHYEYLINYTFLATFGSVFANMTVAKMQSYQDIYEEEEHLKILSSLDIVDIFSLSTSFIFAGACAFFFCKRSH